MRSLQRTPMAHEAEEYPAMSESTTDIRIVPLPTGQDVLTDILRDGARRLLAEAVEAEVAAWIDAHAHLKDQAGHQQVVRNGHLLALPRQRIDVALEHPLARLELGPVQVAAAAAHRRVDHVVQHLVVD